MMSEASDIKLSPGAIYSPSGPTPWPPPDEPVKLGPGPHLFVDDYLVADQENLTRSVTPPERLPEPVITGEKDDNFQPWFTVIRDPSTRRFRIWYNVPTGMSSSHIAYLESADGVHWKRPYKVLEDPAAMQFGASSNARNADGKTALHCAVRCDWTRLSPQFVHRVG